MKNKVNKKMGSKTFSWTRTGRGGKHNIFSLGGAFSKVKSKFGGGKKLESESEMWRTSFFPHSFFSSRFVGAKRGRDKPHAKLQNRKLAGVPGLEPGVCLFWREVVYQLTDTPFIFPLCAKCVFCISCKIS